MSCERTQHPTTPTIDIQYLFLQYVVIVMAGRLSRYYILDTVRELITLKREFYVILAAQSFIFDII